ncbi:hypothetical protein GCM10022243_41060 [Saccharothrix violaceirubra]|uniref:Flagellar assembly protein FliH n=1 Tax=Saccharothrix violaceirubra TaxID=413306 RepID=A0A7W7T859_9PSEU|nr:FliH/SctL family protein [Saccharothrix violaceirubra]MBB4968362.1 flagellar assembly protein FliH [Saccharothrix violaceirubra]
MSSSTEHLSTGTVLRDVETAVPYRVGPRGVPTIGTVRAGAHAEGYAVGWAQGIREAREATSAARARATSDLTTLLADRDARIGRAVAAVAAAADQVRAITVQRAEEIAEPLVAAAVDLAESLLGATLAVDAPAAARAAVRRALANVPERKPVVVRLNPADLAELAEAETPTLSGAPVSLAADPSVGRGDAVAETDTTTVYAVLAEALAAVRAELGALTTSLREAS